MKYFLASIAERNGDREYSHDFKLKAKTPDEAEGMLKYLAQRWYGDCDNLDAEDDEDFTEGRYWHNGEVICQADGCQEISAKRFKALDNIHDLTTKAGNL